MKKVLTTIALSLSALIATSAMAAPHHDARFNHPSHAPAHWNSNDKHPSKQHWNNDKRYNSYKVNPSRDWRVGQPLPRQYDSSRYKVDYREAKNLKKPSRNQAWYKVNGDYVLVNTKTDKILRIS
ncbi:RcnB family protein [Acinetobacter faecalis]|uniref:RcnB family protein n=1 Tax=Acinetobacter faecalis TaxID=2665161 RepID=A0ABU5GMN8_9GAMM|nr:RcnB family protein [Acinetobacter faecalis]MDY6459624.1 RcnB family protein [Acinetobacter faecalis]MDY6485233.1 RcnB family protein [Acinetobacter faecalis]MDY6490086.1 RcnB family protein [Acinetobacter faecalis]MDY6531154.1 RcnB family protein [Acinetobacter faecalis]MDY6537260.1 RcnB family protein [Acinetobacter faecalis]